MGLDSAARTGLPRPRPPTRRPHPQPVRLRRVLTPLGRRRPRALGQRSVGVDESLARDLQGDLLPLRPLIPDSYSHLPTKETDGVGNMTRWCFKGFDRISNRRGAASSTLPLSGYGGLKSVEEETRGSRLRASAPSETRSRWGSGSCHPPRRAVSSNVFAQVLRSPGYGSRGNISRGMFLLKIGCSILPAQRRTRARKETGTPPRGVPRRSVRGRGGSRGNRTDEGKRKCRSVFTLGPWLRG